MVAKWWFEPQPRGRVAVFRTIVYGFIFADVFLTTSWVAGHATLPDGLYMPLFFARLLQLPHPGPVMVPVVQVLLLASAAIALTGRWPRLAGTLVFFLYLQWMFIAFSYGKVDHDRVAFLVALAVLPTAGPARWGDRTTDEKAGWALRMVQVAVVLTYFLAAFAKFRFGGLEWLHGATLMRAVLRRGTFLADPLEAAPLVLQVAQYAIVALELASPLLLVRGRIGKWALGAAFVFHAVTYATITIIFLPHLVALLSFVPLERLPRPRVRRWIQSFRFGRPGYTPGTCSRVDRTGARL